jgi:hypothetical protein
VSAIQKDQGAAHFNPHEGAAAGLSRIPEATGFKPVIVHIYVILKSTFAS